MTQDGNNSNQEENRVETRTIVDKFYSLEFSVKELAYVFQFRIWNISEKGMCILVREDSALIEHIKVGDTFKMKYYQADPLGPAEHLETEVRHITKDDHGRFKGHFLLGLMILGRQSTDKNRT